MFVVFNEKIINNSAAGFWVKPWAFNIDDILSVSVPNPTFSYGVLTVRSITGVHKITVVESFEEVVTKINNALNPLRITGSQLPKEMMIDEANDTDAATE